MNSDVWKPIIIRISLISFLIRTGNGNTETWKFKKIVTGNRELTEIKTYKLGISLEKTSKPNKLRSNKNDK